MSSNPLHITRSNYEEYFLLYTDGELNPAQMDAVDQFAAAHPDLQEELELLLHTQLEAPSLSFDKSALFAESMQSSVIDEALLLYVDGELDATERKKVAAQLEQNADYARQHQQLLQTRLPLESLVYPHKKELYRREEQTIRPVIWFRVAAAVFALLAGTYMWQLGNNGPADSGTAVVTPAVPTATGHGSTPATRRETVAAAQPDPAGSITDGAITAPVATVRKRDSVAGTHTRSTTAQPDVTNSVAIVPTQDAVAINTTEHISSVSVSQQQTINNPSVTPATPDAYHSIEAAASQPAVTDVAATEPQDKKGGSVKGFLRKATRFIERRTGIDPTNDDEELLIGAVAIKLK